MRFARVLIADPDESLLALYREFLTREGFVVATATDGLDCMAKLRSFAPDVLVLEPAQLWGGGDGVLARMREEADIAPAKVLILSTRRNLDRLDRGSTLSISDYQIKPVSPDLLTERIRHLLEPSPSLSEGDHSPVDTGRHTPVPALGNRAD
jgi:two-component system alkaline phosphatase synthesis response regulator PhoP